MLAGLRHGRTLGTPLALVVRNRDHANWEWGMSPWPAEGEPEGKGTTPVTLPRPGHADLAGTLKYGLADARDALERASARQTALTVVAGALAKALLEQIGVEATGAVLEMGDVDEATGQVARVGRPQRGVGQTLASAVGREEVLQNRQALAEVRADRDVNDPAFRIEHESAHTGHLADLVHVSLRARVRHHVDGVLGAEPLADVALQLVTGTVPNQLKLAQSQVDLSGFPLREAGALDLQADELGAVGVAVLVEPVGEDE